MRYGVLVGMVMASVVGVASPSFARIQERSITTQDLRTGNATASRAPTPTTRISTASAAPEGYASFDDDSLETERPRITRGLDTVGKKTFQVETSFAYENDRAGAVRSTQYSFPTKLRYGIVEKWEVQVLGNMATFRDSNAGDASGFGDLFLGTKWSALEGGGMLPSLGVVGELGLPTGSNNLSGNTVQPRGNAIFAWQLPWELGLDANLGMDLPPKDGVGDRFARVTYGTAVGRRLPFFSERMTTFVEFAGATPLKSGKKGTHQAGTGLGLRIKDNMQLDSFARVGLNSAAPNFQTGMGFSWRM